MISIIILYYFKVHNVQLHTCSHQPNDNIISDHIKWLPLYKIFHCYFFAVSVLLTLEQTVEKCSIFLNAHKMSLNYFDLNKTSKSLKLHCDWHAI